MSHKNVPNNIWSKVKSSTKSLSSSIQHLSIKGEHDGDTPHTTLVHKALVKYYTNKEPFQGFPEWLDHKTDPIEEQKIMMKQKRQTDQPSNVNKFEVRNQESNDQNSSTHINTTGIPQRRTPGSFAFRRMVSSSQVTQGNNTVTQERTAESFSLDAGKSSLSSAEAGLPVQSRTDDLDSVRLSSNRYDSVSSRMMQDRLRINRVNSSSAFGTRH